MLSKCSTHNTGCNFSCQSRTQCYNFLNFGVHRLPRAFIQSRRNFFVFKTHQATRGTANSRSQEPILRLWNLQLHCQR
jgi:hypothetical protein